MTSTTDNNSGPLFNVGDKLKLLFPGMLAKAGSDREVQQRVTLTTEDELIVMARRDIRTTPSKSKIPPPLTASGASYKVYAVRRVPERYNAGLIKKIEHINLSGDTSRRGNGDPSSLPLKVGDWAHLRVPVQNYPTGAEVLVDGLSSTAPFAQGSKGNPFGLVTSATPLKNIVYDDQLEELLFSLSAASLVAIWIIVSLPIPWPKFIRKLFVFLVAPFLPTLTTREAEELDVRFAQQDASHNRRAPIEPIELNISPPYWRTAFLIVLSCVELTGWLAVAIYNLIQFNQQNNSAPFSFLPWTSYLIAFAWVYVLARILHTPPVTPPYDLFILFSIYFFQGVYHLGYAFFFYSTKEIPLPSNLELLAQGVNVGILLCLLLVVFSLPLNAQRLKVTSKDELTPTPEDYTSLASWALFSWVDPLVSFKNIKRLKLLRANSMDLIIDVVFTEVSMVFDFAGPFFLQYVILDSKLGNNTQALRFILKELESPTNGSRQKLYIYAIVTFVANCFKAESDAQHLWYARRASSRMGSQLSAAVYDKTLRIIDQSGTVDKKTEENRGGDNPIGKDGKEASKTKKEEDENKKEDESNTSVGKIVNILAIDVYDIFLWNMYTRADPPPPGADYRIKLSQ
ncbi:hypothetical protein Clacol_002185 [Clathrus columnatus]|uniref:Uncharacterized protein n=1 Tax=Clathrus columnatus TaxID=1419009 RepID=A0AAV5A5P9_9AGAM|nr:hypothetical protein Clacol_002185 [Clathrus columnatus]